MATDRKGVGCSLNTTKVESAARLMVMTEVGGVLPKITLTMRYKLVFADLLLQI